MYSFIGVFLISNVLFVFLQLDPSIYESLQKEKVEVGDVIYIEANSGAVKVSYSLGLLTWEQAKKRLSVFLWVYMNLTYQLFSQSIHRKMS